MPAGSDSAQADRSGAGLRRAALTAGLLSGAPSTAYALARGADLLEATRAAGRLLLPDTGSEVALLGAAALAHATLTAGWTAVLGRLPGGALSGAGYGLAVAALDLGLARAVRGRRFGPVADLAPVPQLADHVVFGVVVGVMSCPSGRRARRQREF